MGAAYAISVPDPVQFMPTKASNEKWAVLFGTWCGSARDAALWVSEGLGGIAAVFDVRLKPDLKPYDHVVIGTAIHGGKGPQLLESYIQENVADLKSKVRGLFVVCGSQGDHPGPRTVAAYIDGYLAKLCQASAPASRAFPGRITKALLSEEDYKMLDNMYKGQNKPFDDYDHLSRWECMEFGKAILASRSPAAKKQ
jgi:menaquinone-dependent protoporphyrinogen IX oxidase